MKKPVTNEIGITWLSAYFSIAKAAIMARVPEMSVLLTDTMVTCRVDEDCIRGLVSAALCCVKAASAQYVASRARIHVGAF